MRRRTSVVIHGHFYQPPRENPWTGRVPVQISAAPHHDWNARIHDECYRAVVAARILDGEGRIAHVMNTLAWMSWDAGPTLLEWMVREEPETYEAFIDADRLARARTGHGGALATPYHHVILPLASRREKTTEVRWGIADFRRRFGRDPDGMWLPEAAVDTETLEVLAAEGIRFTVLGPTQVRAVPAHGLPGRVPLSNGRSIAVFVYDGPLSHDVAFGAMLQDSSRWLERLLQHAGSPTLVSVATDGETFGHHHRWGEMALAALLSAAGRRPELRLDNYGAFLARNPPVEDVEVVEPSSWSCVHGVGRWRSACGCQIDPSRLSSQDWRSVLRDALEWLALELNTRYEREAAALLRDPWAALDEYGGVMGGGSEIVGAFLDRHAARPLDRAARTRALELLEMERDVLRMRTSCAWFFDDVARLEPLQNLLYAAHALDLAGREASMLEAELVSRLDHARSNDPKEGSAADMWRRRVRGPSAREENEENGVGAGRSQEAPFAVARLLAEPWEGSLGVALEEIDTAPESVRHRAQSLVAREVARRLALSGPAAAIAERLGVAAEANGHGLPEKGPVRFVFGLHVHQPVGNFDHVFESHVEDVYLPFLERCAERRFLPLALHVSGPLLEWLERKGNRYLDLIGRLVDEGRVEPLLAGFYEPVLPVLSRADRIEQIGWMRDWLARRFGADARGLWLTERVWEPGLAHDLADAGVEHVLVDDRHFLVAGFERVALDRPWRTESEGRSLAVLPIDERLRYLIPFRSPPEIGAYLRNLAAGGHAVAVLADDGEKFGGWPGTADWVWKRGWLNDFLTEMEYLTEQGVVTLATPSSVVRDVPAAGLAYLPSASYREMELWSLPPAAAATMEHAGERLGAEAAAALRGGHWRGFLAKYEESNRMHKKAQVLSELCRSAGDPQAARRAIGRAQCNDAYWHGVFGGLYLRHLRNAIWQNLAEAERILRAGQGLEVERRDVDGDGRPEIWVHSGSFSALLSPHRGGALLELTDFASGVNLADVLTRRRESYHRITPPPAHPPQASDDGGMPSIHELEGGLRVERLPPVDLDVRNVLIERVIPYGVEHSCYEKGEYAPAHSWAAEVFEADVSTGRAVTVSMRALAAISLEKSLEITEHGAVEVSYAWDPAELPADAWFAPEISVAEDRGVTFEPEPDVVWRHDIVTVSKRESGLEETVQGRSITPLWPCSLGAARVLLPASAEPTR